MQAIDDDLAACEDPIEGTNRGVGGKREHGRPRTLEAGRGEELRSERSPDIVQIAGDDNRCPCIEVGEWCLAQKATKLQLAFKT